MYDSHPSVNRLRVELISSGFTSSETDEIIKGLNHEIAAQVEDLVIDAIEDAMNIASNIGAEEFIEDVMVDMLGYNYRLTTQSGKTDYSTPPIDMKSHLLEKAKVSKTGKRYRQIPLQDNNPVNDLFDIQAKQAFEQVSERRKKAAARKIGSEVFSEGDIAKTANEMVDARKRFYEMKEAKKLRGETKIRTVSDDSPEDSWIIPARDLDMTMSLNEINRQLAASTDMVIRNTVNFYAEEFV